MTPRKVQTDKPVILPKEWSDEVENLLNNIYQSQIEGTNKGFCVFGRTFPNEVLLAFSLVDGRDESVAPVTYYVSADLEEKTEVKKVLDSLVDSVGVFFDTYFATQDWDGYHQEWLEGEYANQKFSYMVSRENVALTILADELLKDSDL